MKDIIWSSPQRLSPIALFTSGALFFRYALRFGWYLLIPLFINFTPERLKTTLIGFGIVIILAFILGIAYFYFFRFRLEEKEFIVQQWFFTFKKTSIPYDRIQSVSLEQGFWHQILEVYQVKIDSAGSKTEEVFLRAIEPKVALALKDELDKRTSRDEGRTSFTEKAEDNSSAADQIESEWKSKLQTAKFSHQLSFGRLLLVGLTENHLKTSTYLLALLFYLPQFNDQFKLDDYFIEQIEERSFDLMSLALWLKVLLWFLLISILISAIRIFLKYNRYILVQNNHNIKAKHGLFRIRETQMKLSRIQLVTVIQNPFQKLFNFMSLQLSQVGGSEYEGEGQVTLPGINQQHYGEWMRLYRSADPDGVSEDLIKIHPYRKKYLIIGMLFLTAVALAVMFVFQNALINWPLSLVWLLMLIFHIRSYQLYGVIRYPDGIRLTKAFFEMKTVFTKYEKIQEVTLSRGPIGLIFGFYQLQLKTAGGYMILPYLDLSTASEMRDYLLYQIEKHEKAWM
ncbi:MAG: PH domain-containing protein [Cyclobacteriaceae bacterium]|nr:PH domain-containing protein [Cyclobacteriaceae bacterium]MCH8514800.1 PH domain-containing protein [Cyclobacteriaceae bacterium]